MTSAAKSFVCSYCLKAKSIAERSDEHIWPESLGGDPLGWPWRSNQVCRFCNNVAGQWVDAAFVRSWFGSHERRSDTELYLDPRAPHKAVAPFAYMGTYSHAELRDEETAELWLGPAGETILHVRPRHEEVWDVVTGGKPTKKRSEGGHAYLAFTSAEPFWVHVALWSFQRHFKFATRTLSNANMPVMARPLTPVNPHDAEQARHLRILESTRGEVKTQSVLAVDFSSRFLAKLALGLGRETLGDAFLETPYARLLSHALWERDFERRQAIAVLGSGFFGELSKRLEGLSLSWPAGWLLITQTSNERRLLTIVTPSGKAMAIQVSDDPELIDTSGAWSKDGQVFLAIPPAGEAIGSIPLPDYLAFLTGVGRHPELERLKSLQRDRMALPPKMIGSK